MPQVLLTLISHLNSSVFVLLVILAVAFYLVWKSGGWCEKFISHDKRLTGMEDLSSRVIEINTKVDLIYKIVNPQSPTRMFSPISLTKVGDEIVKKINADEIYKKHSTQLISYVDGLSPKNAYDIQTHAFNVVKGKMQDLLSEDELKVIKQEAFERGLLVEDVLSIFGVLLRNNILKDKNIPIAEVDRHDPQNKPPIPK